MNGRYFWLSHHKKSQVSYSSPLHDAREYPNHCKNQSSSSSSSSEAREDQIRKKLEHQNHNKLLTLDPQSNHPHHHFYHPHHRFPLLQQQDDDDDRDSSSLSPSPKEPAFRFHLQYLQQNHSCGAAGLDTELHPSKKRSYLLPPPPALPPSSSSSSSSSITATVEYATNIGESANHHEQLATTSSRLAMRGGGGEIVEVQGGHIVRSTGRKDRHSKVCTAKGPRDRRVRLSAHTAIQFYDVQDRLGYDRPSKAVDWLIKNAKAAIDELAKLPAWNPNTVNQNAQQEQEREQNQMVSENVNENESPIGVHRAAAAGTMASGSREAGTPSASGGRILEQLGENPNRGGSGFLPQTMGTDIADSIKSFFPIGATAALDTNSSSIQFQNYPSDLLSRTSSACQNQDLRLSLQSFQDPILLHQAQTQTQRHHQHQQNEQLFSATTPLGFDGASFPEEHGRLHRMVAWNGAAADTGNSGHGEGGGFVFNSPSPMPTLPPLLFGQSQYLIQRGPLQSSNNPSIRAWIDSSTTDQHHHYLPPTIHHQSSIAGGIGFDSNGFSGFRIPARIQGEEEHNGVSDKPSSASSDSRH